MPECETCGRDDVDLLKVRRNTWYCSKHLGLFTKHWEVNPYLRPFETSEVEQPFQYLSVYQPPPGEGYDRYASTWLRRSPDRIHWTDDYHFFVMDEFGFLVHVKTLTSSEQR